MKRMRFAFVLVAAALLVSGSAIAQEVGSEHRLSLSLCGGMKDFEGDEVVKDSGFGSIALTYDYSHRWTFEAVVSFYPQLLGGEREIWGSTSQIGVTNRLLELTGVEKTSAIGLTLECLYHLTRWDRVDPYFVIGGGVMFYQDDVGDGATHPTGNAGLGVLYHFDDRLAVRADARAFIAGTSAFEANSLINVGIVYTLGVPSR